MRGRSNPQSSFICLVNIEDRIHREHPIREVKRQIEAVLKSMDEVFEKLHAAGGRSSVPPERLLKARVLMALYSVRSERQFCERLPYDALFQWLMDINMEEAAEFPGEDAGNGTRDACAPVDTPDHAFHLRR